MISLPPLDGVRHCEVPIEGVRIHLAELGPEDAPPILMVHGWPQNWWCWRRVAPLLAGEHRCLMPDLRGFGWSDAPRSGYEKDRLADDLLAVLDHLGLEQVAFIGHDWGAYLGMLLAMQSPQRLSALLALSIPHPWPSWRDRLNPLRLAAFTYQLPLSTPVIGERLVRSGITRWILERSASPGTYSEDDLEAFDRPMRSAEQARATVLLYRTFLLREFPAVAAGRFRGSRVTIPAELVVGDRDPIVRGADLTGYRQHAPRMAVERLPRVGHFLPDEVPLTVAEHARQLFASPAPSARPA